MDKNKKITVAAQRRDHEEEYVPEPPPSYSHRAELYAINSLKHDVDFDPGVVGYGSTLPAVHCSTQQPLLGDQAPDNANLTQRYQQIVFSRFVCILFLFGCCTLFNLISVSLNSTMIALNLDGVMDFWSIQILSLSTKGSFLLATFVPLLTCCCCLGIRSPRGSFFARVSFYIFTAIFGTFLFVYMFGEAILYVCVTQAYDSIDCDYYNIYENCIDSNTVGYVYAVICINFLAVIFYLAMFIAAMYACIKDPQRRCSNQCIQMCVYITFLLISGTLAIITIVIPVSVILSSIHDTPKLLEAYSLAVISCSGAHLFLIFLFISLTGPLFCILEIRESPFFSSILKYAMTFSWLISLLLFANGVLSIMTSAYLSNELRNVLTTAHLHPPVVIAMFAFSAVVNFIVAMIVTIIWFLCTCSSCVHAIVLCCCLFYHQL